MKLSRCTSHVDMVARAEDTNMVITQVCDRLWTSSVLPVLKAGKSVSEAQWFRLVHDSLPEPFPDQQAEHKLLRQLLDAVLATSSSTTSWNLSMPKSPVAGSGGLLTSIMSSAPSVFALDSCQKSEASWNNYCDFD